MASIGACSCAEGTPPTDSGTDTAVEDAGTDADTSDGGEDASDAGFDAAEGSMPETCGNGFFEEFERCDPAAGNVTPELRCDCDDHDSCTLDRCKAGTSVEECTCECEHVSQHSVMGVGTCNDGDVCTNDIVRCDNPNNPNDMSCATTCEIVSCENPDISECTDTCGNGMLDPNTQETCDDSSPNQADHCMETDGDDGNECTHNNCVGNPLGCTWECEFPYKTGFPYDTCNDGKDCTDDTGTADPVTCTNSCMNTVNPLYDDAYCNVLDTVCRDFMPDMYNQETCAVGCTYTPVAAWYTNANTQCANAALVCANGGIATGHDLLTCTHGCTGYTPDNDWLNAYCRAQEPRACRSNTVATYNLINPSNTSTCDTTCTASFVDVGWLTAQQMACTAATPGCLDQAMPAFTYNPDTPSNNATCDGECQYTHDMAWLATACNDGNACTTETPAFLQTAATIAANNSCAVGTAYTCNRVDTTLNPDPIDAASTDTNCDGIDGVRSDAILVSTTGSAVAACGRTDLSEPPCLTVTAGYARAVATNRHYVYVQTGDYAGPTTITGGLSSGNRKITILGGWGVPATPGSMNWTRGAYTAAGFTTTLNGGLDGATSRYLAVRVHTIPASAIVGFENLTIVGPNAPTVSGAGASGITTYAVHASGFGAGAYMDFVGMTVDAGNGSSGIGGTSGVNAPEGVNAIAGMHGGNGGNASERGDTCNDSGHGGGGAAGTNSCSVAGRATNGGAGGAGGEQDTNCTAGLCAGNACNATGGDSGNNAAYVNGGWGALGGGSGPGNPSGMGGTAGDGYVQNGAAGPGGNLGSITGGTYSPRAGGPGGLGEHGGGGGGGGGSGGSDDDADDWGAGGGGGGAGGCRAQGVGSGGGAGGASFGVFLVGAVRADFAVSVQIVRGNGGNGASGGNGGQGQAGGNRGTGGNPSEDAGQGGHGGFGAHGGHGGGGGGGAGGHSVGVLRDSSGVVNGTPSFSSGVAGSAGAGGISAPSAVGGQDDGNDGVSGTAGVLQGIRVCADTNNC